MYSSTVPSSQILLRQLMNESGIASAEQELNLKRQFQRKFSHHINLMQYHRLREDRFIMSQKRVLEKQNNSIQKAKQFLELRIEKANSNKVNTLRGRSKKMEDGLSKWEIIVKKNKQEQSNRIKQSETLIQNWNEKLSSSSSRKSFRLGQLAKNLKEKSQQKLQKVSSFRSQVEAKLMKNPQQYKRLQKQQRERYLESRNQQDTKRSSRISTQGIYDKKKKQQQNLLQKSLVQTVNKEERINEARHIKAYLLEKKKKQRLEKQQAVRKLRENNLNSLKSIIQERNEVLDEKYKNSRVKARKRSSLPQIQGSRAVSIAITGPGQQWRKKDILTPSINPYSPAQNKNYDRLITEKLKDLSMIMRRHHHND